MEFMLRVLLFAFITCYFSPGVCGQSANIPIGAWRQHSPSHTVLSITQAPQTIFAATPFGVIEFNRNDNSVRKIDRVMGLSGYGISAIQYSPDHNLVIIGYNDGQIDIWQNGRVIAISDIRNSRIFGSRRINEIFLHGNRAYMSCDFGIVVLDLIKFVIRDTWFIGHGGRSLRINDFLKTEDYFYAATDSGLMKAPIDAPNPADFNFWSKVLDLPVVDGRYSQVELFNDKLWVNYSGGDADTLYYFDHNRWNVFSPNIYSGLFEVKEKIRGQGSRLIVVGKNRVDIFDENHNIVYSIDRYLGNLAYPLDALVDNDGRVWVGDSGQGLVHGTPANGFESVMLSGPPTSESFRVAHSKGKLWVAPGAIIGGWQPTWNDRGIFLFEGGNWHQYWRWQYPLIFDVRDIIQITPHISDPGRAFAAAWSGGLIEVDREKGIVNLYNETNSTLQLRAGVGDIIRIGGSAWDSQGNLWVSNSDADHFISVRTPNGNWMSYPHNGLISSGETLGTLIVDNYDQKWITMPRGGGIIVFKEQSTDNNRVFNIRKLNAQEGNGSLPNTRVLSLANDHNGHIWVGTAEGVVVFYSPHLVFRGGAFDAQPIIVMQDGFAGRLFEQEAINSIFVDGSNKKWIGTRNSGAFLMSPDGTQTILHFNTSNSPLPSDNILDISIEPLTGEVFFATDQGLVSYRGFATTGLRKQGRVEVFPNPVRPGYEGYIAVRGLVVNARVKITDISGNLIHDGQAEGGQFVWNGRDMFGNKPATGVYLVFSTNDDGTETVVAKILFLN